LASKVSVFESGNRPTDDDDDDDVLPLENNYFL
jgi:hypothetical protein